MVIPARVPDLHEAHAALDEPARDEQLLARLGVAVGGANVGRLLVDVEHIGGLGLHAERDLVGLEARLERRVLREVLLVERVERVDEVELAALLGLGDVGVADVLDHLLHVLRLGVDARALIDAGQERRAVVPRAAGRQAAGAQGDKAGEVLVLAAEAVDGPRAEARLSDTQRTGVHEHGRNLVRRDVGIHRADDRHVVHVLRGLGEELADLDARLAVGFELERRAHRDAVAPDGLVVHFREHRFRIPGIHVRRGALREDVDDGLGLAGKLGRMRCEGIRPIRHAHGRQAHPRRVGHNGLRASGGGDETEWIEQAGETQSAEAQADAVEELAAGQEIIRRVGRNTTTGMILIMVVMVVGHQGGDWLGLMTGGPAASFLQDAIRWRVRWRIERRPVPSRGGLQGSLGRGVSLAAS